ncbi:MAG: hypothetical protein HLUCCO17_05350 [Saliniramus fredricksonii]|uniref:Uncharacterized protein n=2 Tax=Saliniramus fredricksonii TaxID=1653334 RepID=A0A0P8BPV1_9HYPH|nr:MAG: hypothetical protein HLUCCO17_05350 [Saliniramus fredricksonii]SCC80365.1 hypothetical protein GA0071312_1450 [Saliniramus fredricksonii]
MSGGVLSSGSFAGANPSYLAELRTRPVHGPPEPTRPAPGAPSQPATPAPAPGTGSSASGPSAADETRAQVARDRAVFREAMGLAVQDFGFREALPTAAESPSRAVARKLPGSPENPNAVMKEVRADMEAWEERREANRKLMQQLDAMVYRS